MTEKTLDDYMNLPYRVEIIPEADGLGFTAIVPELPGCMTSTDNMEELGDQVKEAKELWLATALGEGDYIPEPVPQEIDEPSGKFLVRMPRSLHGQLASRADREGVSLNQLVVSILSSGMGSWIASVGRSQGQFRRILELTQKNQETIGQMLWTLTAMHAATSAWESEELGAKRVGQWDPGDIKLTSRVKKAA